MTTIDYTTLETKKRKLETVRAALKEEFFGIDSVIDKVIESIQTWYMMPEAVTRPVIVNLFGMTGVGKTALVRSLVKHLQFGDRFLEVQMDGFSSTSSYNVTTISGLIGTSGIKEREPGIILLDEFQRFRTVNDKGEDIKLERFPDVWMLLSDGLFPSNSEKLEQVLMWMEYDEYWEDNRLYNEAVSEAKGEEKADTSYMEKVKYKRRFMTDRNDAKSVKTLLRRPESVREIMTWDRNKVRKLIEERLALQQDQPFDYSKCLVFVSGNLDEAFRMANSVEDCDTSADVFYEHSLKVGVTEIKAALATRFRPEQIARLGNNHIIYPSLSKSAYMSLIRRSCREYTEQTRKVCGITFTIDEDVYKEVYDNSVYPAQGTRPVFTSIHKLFGSPLADGVLWAMQHSISEANVSLDIPASSLVFSHANQQRAIKVDFEIRAKRKSRSADFNALVAVHEAGHAIVYAALFKRTPVEVAINVASFKGGYNLYQDTFLCKDELLCKIATSMGGIVAEEVVFGQELRSSGCEGDVRSATATAGQYVRRYAMDGRYGMITTSMDNLYLEDVKSSDKEVERLIEAQKERAQTVLTANRALLLDLSQQLIKIQKMDGTAFKAFVGDRIPGLQLAENADVNNDYAARLARAIRAPVPS